MTPEERRDQLNEIWDDLNETSVDYLKSEFKSIAPKLTEFLIVSLLNEDEIDFGIYHDGKKEGAMVSYDIYDNDKMLELKMDGQFNISLDLTIHDFDGNPNTFTYPLKGADLEIIPPGLVNILSDVVRSKKGKTVFVKSIHE